jgi:putative ABC transport system permease protein
MIRGLMSLWLHMVSLIVPSGERRRWRDEWHSDVDAVEGLGAGLGSLMSLVLGMARAAMIFRFEGMSMDGWTKEVIQAIRGLLRRPGFTAVAVLTLGLGIGANSAIFSVVNGVILEPLQYPDSENLVMMTSAFPTLGFDEFWISPPEFMEVSERTRSFQTLGGFTTNQVSIGGDDRPERVNGAFVTSTLFDALGVTPGLGRHFSEEEDQPGAAPVAVLSQELWQKSFGGDRAIIGRSIDVDGSLTTIVGVMPTGFDVDDSQIEIWQPLGLDWTNRTNHGSHYLYLVGRLAPGVTVSSAQQELTTFVQRWPEDVQTGHISFPNHPLNIIGLREEVVGEVRPALMILLGAVGFVLLIACANVANLLLARAEDRHKEVAVRVALGAGRGRLLRQFLTEGVVLSLAGGALGVGLAGLSLMLLKAASPGDLPRLTEIHLDGTVLLFTTGIALATGVIFGLAPARHVSARGLGMALRDGGTRSTSSVGQGRLRSLLVISETALALILAVGAGLMIRSFGALTAVEPGFEPEGLLTFQVFLPNNSYPDAASLQGFQDRLLTQLAAQPGVTGVAAMSGLPPMRPLDANDTQFEGIAPTQDGPPQNVDFFQVITADYLETMQIAVVEGRGFTSSDDAGAIPVALVNESLAKKFYPGESPIGRRIGAGSAGGSNPLAEIVGVVADVKQSGLDSPAGTELYFHYPQAESIWFTPNTMNYIVATSGDPTSLMPGARKAVLGLDRALPVANLQPMTKVVGDAVARARFLTSLLAVFAGLALLLAAVGTYGVMSYAVAQRSRELGIRMAMGAEAGMVQKLVLTQGLRVAAVGLLAGIAGAWGLTGILQSMLFDVDARDPVSFILGPVVLTLVAIAACWIPARRATRVDPVTVLREE